MQCNDVNVQCTNVIDSLREICLSGMAGHALYGMAPCFGHTGVTFDAENDRPGPSSLRGHFEASRGHCLRLKALF